MSDDARRDRVRDETAVRGVATACAAHERSIEAVEVALIVADWLGPAR